MTESSIQILFQNQDFAVLNKPAGMSFHSEETQGFVVQAQQLLAVDKVYPVHRLDKMTSGLLIVAFNKKAAQAFQQLFEQRLIDKIYLAISDQKPKKKQGWIKGDMAPARRGSWKLLKNQSNPAITQFKSFLIQPGERLFVLKPHTGKTHQLRVAMKSNSAPICGDNRYALTDKANAEDRGYLHAYALKFELFKEKFEFICPPDSGQRYLSSGCQTVINGWGSVWQLFDKT